MSKRPLRSARWFDADDLRGFGHRSRLMQMGYGPEDWNGRPVVAVVNTWSDINPCHAHFKHRVEDVKRGILQAGGFPLELPAISLSENFVKPTSAKPTKAATSISWRRGSGLLRASRRSSEPYGA